MNGKSALSFKAITDFYGDYAKHALPKGENALESGHLIAFSYDGECNCIKAKVQSSMKSSNYTVNVDLKSRTEIGSASCTCARGQVSCHHIAAALLYAFKNVSCTDKGCAWSVRNVDRNTGVCIDDLRAKPVKKIEETVVDERKKNRKKKISDGPPCAPLTVEEKKNLKEKLKHCKGAALAFAWLLEEDKFEENPEEIFQENDGKIEITVVQPRDVVFQGRTVEDLQLSSDQILKIVELTKGQRENPLWFFFREWRLTASQFGDALKCFYKLRGPYTPALSTLRSLYEPRDLSKIKTVKWGIDHEKTALDQFSEDTGFTIPDTGLWLSSCGFLGASPDGFIGDDIAVEVKCPYEFRNSVLKEVLQLTDKYFVKYTKDGWMLDPKHPYYHQIQGQLYCTGRKICYFIVWTTKSYEYFVIPRDEEWIKTNIPLLEKFYTNFFIPFIIQEEEKKKVTD